MAGSGGDGSGRGGGACLCVCDDDDGDDASPGQHVKVYYCVANPTDAIQQHCP